MSSKYDSYEEMFDPMRYDRQARRKRKPKVHHQPKKSRQQILAESAEEMQGLEGGFQPTYKPGPFEAGWLLNALKAFYDQGQLKDILGRVKGGKEANVYRCVGEHHLIAAKVYRPRMFRNLRNDKLYREGRGLVDSEGRAVRSRDYRILKAAEQKTSYGEQVQHTSWLMYEYKSRQTLYDAGASVPQPIATSGNAILMTYLGDEKMGAPALNEVRLSQGEAESFFEEILRNINLMLTHSMIHGDLSPYNVLYWDGKITLIDFPQVTNSRTNSRAYFILRRDVQRICEYFEQYGLSHDYVALTDKLWRLHGGLHPRDQVQEAVEQLRQD